MNEVVDAVDPLFQEEYDKLVAEVDNLGPIEFRLLRAKLGAEPEYKFDRRYMRQFRAYVLSKEVKTNEPNRGKRRS
jgi:hypothetical protein